MKTRYALPLSKVVLLVLLLGVAFLTGDGSSPAQAAYFAQSAGVQKMIIEKGSPAENLPGLELWHDYGSFALYRVTGSNPAGLSAASLRGVLATSPELDQILIEARSFNPLVEKISLPGALSLADPSGPGLQLVQFVGPIKQEWLDGLQSAGGIPVHYVANNAYLVWMDGSARSQASAMAVQGDILQYSAPYQPYFKVGPVLREQLAEAEDGDEVVPVVIQMYRHPGKAASEEVIKSLSQGQMAPWEEVLAYQNTVAELRIGDVPRIARLPDVTSVALRPERELFDEIQGQILAGAFTPGQTGPSSPGYLAWLSGLGFSQIPEDYPIIDITDDGIGNGTVNSGDSTLHVAGGLSNPTRLAYVQNCTAEVNGGGVGGHGHINTSIAGGYDSRSGAAYNDSEGFNLGLGINPYGRLAGTRVFGTGFNISDCGNTDAGVIRASYTAGARISSNSWGCTTSACVGTYDASSQAYDVGTRDAVLNQAGNQQLTFLFAAGNIGPNAATVGSPGNAKNVITVGASENNRPYWTDGCNVSASGANNLMDIIGFSSRGPAPGGRFKPDLVAPGTHIQGTASTNANYSGEFVCDKYWPPGQTVFASSSGTSHSTPAVAGVTSLSYYWLAKNYNLAAPSPAMLKAYLIGHLTYLTGAGANDTLPSNTQGFGMPNMALAFDSTSRFLVDQSVPFNNSGETWTLSGGIVDPGKPVRIVLVYTDQPGAIGTSPQVNDLNLRVEAGGQTYLGNTFSGAWSTTGGTPDSKNNVEAVFLPAGTDGGLTVTVTAFNIAGDGIPNFGDNTDQDFALVCYNCAETQGFSLEVEPGSQTICILDEFKAGYQVSVDSILGYSSPINLSANGLPDGTNPSFIPNPVTPPGTSALTLKDIPAGLSGSYTFIVQGENADGTKTADAILTLNSSQPGDPALQSPVNEAQALTSRPTFRWKTVPQASTYEVQIALDDQFSNLVDQIAGIESSSYSLDYDLVSGQQYYWRVRAENACGEGGFSPVFSFTVELLPGDCPVGTEPEVLYHTDFESGSAGWSHSGVSDTWALSDSRSQSGLSAFYGRGVSTVSDQYLITPQLSLPLHQAPLSLQFWNYQAIEANSAGSLCFDGAVLEISTNGGTSWSQVGDAKLLTDPYDLVVSSSFGNPIGGRRAWCGNPQDWINSVVSLDEYAGQTVRFRFRLATDQSTSKEGWYIDDVFVKSCRIEDPNRKFYYFPFVGGSIPKTD